MWLLRVPDLSFGGILQMIVIVLLAIQWIIYMSKEK